MVFLFFVWGRLWVSLFGFVFFGELVVFLGFGGLFLV